jgi:hypothetical protein
VTNPASTSQPAAARPKREILGPTGLVVMVVAILAFTVVSIVIELVANHGRAYKATVEVVGPVAGQANEYRVLFHVNNTGSKAGRPDTCEASLYDIKGERVGTAAVTLHQAIAPGGTADLAAIGTAASPPASGAAQCRSLEPD